MDDSRSKKTIRQFNCRDALWTVFEEMARELECSVDYLINEAMRQYAKARKYAVPGAEKAEPMAPTALAPAAPSSPGAPPPRPRMGTPGAMPAAPSRPSPVPPAPPPLAGAQPGAVARPSSPGFAAPPPRPSLFPVEGRATVPSPKPAAMPAPPAPPAAAPEGSPGLGPDTDAFAQMRRAAGAVATPIAQPTPAQSNVSFEVAKAPSTGQGRAPLSLVFNGQRIPIRKEQFVIGRGIKVCDLAIKDSNISRRHAAVLFHNGAYYIKDLNSTNGIEYNGMRIDSKRIEEGDAFKICDYEMKFTFQ